MGNKAKVVCHLRPLDTVETVVVEPTFKSMVNGKLLVSKRKLHAAATALMVHTPDLVTWLMGGFRITLSSMALAPLPVWRFPNQSAQNQAAGTTHQMMALTGKKCSTNGTKALGITESLFKNSQPCTMTMDAQMRVPRRCLTGSTLPIMDVCLCLNSRQHGNTSMATAAKISVNKAVMTKKSITHQTTLTRRMMEKREARKKKNKAARKKENKPNPKKRKNMIPKRKKMTPKRKKMTPKRKNMTPKRKKRANMMKKIMRKVNSGKHVAATNATRMLNGTHAGKIMKSAYMKTKTTKKREVNMRNGQNGAKKVKIMRKMTGKTITNTTGKTIMKTTGGGEY